MGIPMDFAKLGAKDVLDIAMFVESEAKERYELLAQHWERAGNAPVAEFFHRMAGLEELHRQQIAEQRQTMFGNEPSAYRDSTPWEVETPDEVRARAAASLRSAYELALDAEVQAHDYYAGALEYLTDPKVAELFEMLRQAEVQHQNFLKKEMEKLPA
jgi:rubrerythrin